MIDRVFKCPKCGITGETYFSSLGVDLRHFQVRFGTVCRNCLDCRSNTMSIELSYRLLQRNLKFFCTRQTDPSWMVIYSWDTLGSNQKGALLQMVSENWDLFIAALNSNEKLIGSDDAFVLKHAARWTPDHTRVPCITVRDFLSFAHACNLDGCFGQPLAS